MSSMIPLHIPLPTEWENFLRNALESDIESLKTELLSMTKTRSGLHSAGPHARTASHSDGNEILVPSQKTAVEYTRIEGVEDEDDSDPTSSSCGSSVSKHSSDTQPTALDTGEYPPIVSIKRKHA